MDDLGWAGTRTGRSYDREKSKKEGIKEQRGGQATEVMRQGSESSGPETKQGRSQNGEFGRGRETRGGLRSSAGGGGIGTGRTKQGRIPRKGRYQEVRNPAGGIHKVGNLTREGIDRGEDQ